MNINLQALMVISFVVCGLFTCLIGQNTINIPDQFFGDHGFCSLILNLFF